MRRLFAALVFLAAPVAAQVCTSPTPAGPLSTQPRNCIGGTRAGLYCYVDADCTGGGTCSDINAPGQCVGGANNALACVNAFDCPDGRCGHPQSFGQAEDMLGNLGEVCTAIDAVGGGNPAGNDTEMQYNDAGAFGAEAAFTYDSTGNVLSVDNVAVTGVVDGVDVSVHAADVSAHHVATVDTNAGTICASGELLNGDGGCEAIAAGGGTPGGLDTQVQFNNAGSFGGDVALSIGVVGSAVNGVTVSGAVAGSEPTIVAVGPDADIDIFLVGKGVGKSSAQCIDDGADGNCEVHSFSGLVAFDPDSDGNNEAWVGAAGRMNANSGSVTQPGYRFTSDTNTGIYVISADVLALSSGGIEAMRLTEIASVADVVVPNGSLLAVADYGAYDRINSISEDRNSLLDASSVDGVAVELLTIFKGSRLTLAPDTTYSFSAMVTARRTDVDGESALYEILGLVHNNAGTTTLVAPNIRRVLESTAAWDCAITADDALDALVVLCTGEAGKSIQWTAAVKTVRIVG